MNTNTSTILLSLIIILIIILHQPSISSALLWQSSPNSNPKRVLLRDITALTLKEGAYTTGRRSRPLPQLQCVGGDACNKVSVPVIQCRNVGWDGDVQWQCQAEMNDSYRFGATEVSCEGYDHSDDPYILKDSCSVEYTLYYTEKGKRIHKSSSDWFSSQFTGHSSYNDNHYNTVPSTSSKLAKLVWFLVGGLILYSMWMSWFSPSRRRTNASDRGSGNTSGYFGGGRGGGGFFGGGGGFSPHNDPSCAPPSSSSTTGMQPGFWAGLAAGGLLGHFFTPRRPNNSTVPPTFSNTGFGSSSLFGNSHGNRRPVYDRGYGGSSGSKNSNSNTRVSTGYGGTVRR